MRILFLLDYYLPNSSANGVCVEKIVNAFLAQGDEVSILSFGSSEDVIDGKGLKLYYCCKTEEDKQKDNPLLYYLKWVFAAKGPAYERKRVTQQIIDKSTQIINENSIETVICVHLPIETLMAGVILKEKFPNVRFVSYMLDSFSGGFLPNHLPAMFCLKRKIKWENQLLVCFDKIFLMCSSKVHHQRYSIDESWYKKSIYVDIPLFIPKKLSKKTNNDVIKMVFLGTLAENIRTPYYFLKVLSKTTQPLEFIVAGKNYCKDIKQYCKSPMVKIHELGNLPHEEVVEIIEAADVLVNFGNINSNLVPSKIFEYMSTGKPIISTFLTESDSSMHYLQQYQNVLFLDEREKDCSGQILKLDKFIKNIDSMKVDFNKLKELFKLNMPDTFIEYFYNEEISLK